MEKIKIGKIVNAVALKGEVKVYHYSDYKERFEELERILVEQKKETKPYEIEHVRYQKNMVILKLKGVNDRNGAESDIYIAEEDLRVLPSDTYYIRDLLGCEVIDEEKGNIGMITDVLQNPAQDIYQIQTGNGKQVFIPAVADFVKDVNIQEKTVRVRLIPGFLDE